VQIFFCFVSFFLGYFSGGGFFATTLLLLLQGRRCRRCGSLLWAVFCCDVCCARCFVFLCDFSFLDLLSSISKETHLLQILGFLFCFRI
jgi:hypothetical protein